VPAGVVDGLRATRPGLEIVDIGPVIRSLRRSKDPDEIATLRRMVLRSRVGREERMVSSTESPYCSHCAGCGN